MSTIEICIALAAIFLPRQPCQDLDLLLLSYKIHGSFFDLFVTLRYLPWQDIDNKPYRGIYLPCQHALPAFHMEIICPKTAHLPCQRKKPIY